MMKRSQYLQIITVLALSLSGAILVYGFAFTSVIADGYSAAWSYDGSRNFVLFLASGLGLSLVTFYLTRRLLLLAIPIAIWLLMIFGIVPLTTVIFVLLSAFSAGHPVVRKFAEYLPDRMSEVLVSAVIGLSMMLMVVQIMVHFPINHQFIYIIVLLLPIIAIRRSIFKFVIELITVVQKTEVSVSTAVYLIILVSVLLTHTVYVALPENFHDALAVHLSVPHQVRLNGAWNFDFRSYVWAVMPMGGDWLYTVGYLLGGEFAARLLNFSFFIIIISLTVTMLTQKLALDTCIIFGVIIASTPIAFIENATLFVENALSMFLFTAFFLLVYSWNSLSVWSVCAIILCVGAALSTKLHALAPSLLICALVSVRYLIIRRHFSSERFLPFLIVGILLMGLVPYAYAWYVTGNPVFPFFNSLFQSPHYPPVNFVDARWVGNFNWSMLYEMTFRSHLFGENYDGCFGFQHLLLFPTGIISVILVGKFDVRLAALVATAYSASILMNSQYMRYIYPALPLLTVIETYPLVFLQTSQFLSIASKAVMFIIILLNLLFASTSGWILRNFEVQSVFSDRSKKIYLTRMASHRVLNEAVNNTSLQNAKVLYLGSPFGACLNGMPVYANWYNHNLAEKLKLISTYSELFSLLETLKITHLIFEESHTKNASYRDALLELILRNGTNILSVSDNHLYAIK